MKPKILLITDMVGWAFDIQCQGIKNILSDTFDFEVQVFTDFLKVKNEIKDKFDVFYFSSYCFCQSDIPKEKQICCLVGQHGRTDEFVGKQLSLCACSNYTADYFHGKFEDITPLVYVPYGIDMDLFRPVEKTGGSVFKIGFAGNHTRNNKRVKDVLEIINSIKGIQLEMRTLHDEKGVLNLVPYSEMPKFYQGLDAYVCFSTEEGFCYPLLEAASCGLPIVSTDVGCAKKLGGISIVHSKESLKETIEFLRNNRSEAERLGNENRFSAGNFSWWALKEDYKKLFERVLNQARQGEKNV